MLVPVRSAVLSLLLFVALALSHLPAQEPILLLKSFPREAELYEGGERLRPRRRFARDDGAQWREYPLRPGYQVLTLRAEGYRPKWLHVRGNGTLTVDEKLERVDPLFRRRGELGTGGRPKGLAFAPDGRTMVVTNLADTGVDLYRVDPLEHLGRLSLPPEGGSAEGFVEALYLPRRRELWVSQMSTDELHILSSVDYRYLGSVPSGGRWPKMMVTDPGEQRLYVSNWQGQSIGIIDLPARELVGTIEVPGVPRGMEISPGGETLYVGLYEGGDLLTIDLTSESRRVRRIEIGSGALRHLELTKDGRRLYISDMYTGEVILFDTVAERVVRRRRLGFNLNTIDLTPDETLLLVSERGRNNSTDYRLEGPAFGRVFVCDPVTLEPVSWIWGRNQPTGLAVSPNGRFLGFTDFMDDNLELYELTPNSPRAATN